MIQKWNDSKRDRKEKKKQRKTLMEAGIREINLSSLS